MCGIVGIFRKRGLCERDHSSIEDSLKVLSRRGPDGEGVHLSEKVIFGHRRLAILDPSLGAQPWIDSESGVVLTYNGELFNYPELRRDLEARGHLFRTRCDTELLMRAYLEWGEECLDHLTGMFAFAFLDPRRNRLWLARDRLGVKPLYYYTASDDFFAFSSSVAGLLVMPEVRPEWDTVAVHHYLMTIRSTFGHQTLVRNIFTLLPGQCLSLDMASGRTQCRIYWALPALASKDKTPRELDASLIEEMRQRMDATVKGQLISDVPLGGFMSGGLDSSVLIGSIRASGHSSLHTYSTGYQRPGYNEWEHVREAAGFHGITCREVPLREDDFLEDWQRLVAFKGLPLSTPNEVAIMRLSELFGREFRVAMTGEGADEIFGGYIGPTFCAFDYDRAHGLSPGIAPEALHRAYGSGGTGSRREHFFRANSWLSPAFQKTALRDLSKGSLDPFHEIESFYDELFGRFATCSTLDAYLHVHARINLEGLLNRLDSSTMAGSVEGRVPFTDHHLAEWAFQLPDDLKMRLREGLNEQEVHRRNSMELQSEGWVESKRLLRESFTDRVPASILNRAKVSFPVPFIEWFNGPLKNPYLEAIQSSPIAKSLLGIEVMKDQLCPAGEINALLAWPLMNLVVMEKQWGMSL